MLEVTINELVITDPQGPSVKAEAGGPNFLHICTYIRHGYYRNSDDMLTSFRQRISILRRIMTTGNSHRIAIQLLLELLRRLGCLSMSLVILNVFLLFLHAVQSSSDIMFSCWILRWANQLADA